MRSNGSRSARMSHPSPNHPSEQKRSPGTPVAAMNGAPAFWLGSLGRYGWCAGSSGSFARCAQDDGKRQKQIPRASLRNDKSKKTNTGVSPLRIAKRCSGRDDKLLKRKAAAGAVAFRKIKTEAVVAWRRCPTHRQPPQRTKTFAMDPGRGDGWGTRILVRKPGRYGWCVGSSGFFARRAQNDGQRQKQIPRATLRNDKQKNKYGSFDSASQKRDAPLRMTAKDKSRSRRSPE
jgi:hypothetical protein